MATKDQPENGGEPGGRGDRRTGDRRRGDRRRSDRRLPVPLWRRPWAYAAYGVLGALLVVLVVGSLTDDGGAARETLEVETVMAPPPVDPNAPAAAGAPVQDAYSMGDFERLLAEGRSAVGQRVRTEIFCERITQVALRDVDAVNPSVAELADASRRVPAAECRWGATDNAPDFLLLVPPELADRLASAPEVAQDFVRRRRLHVELEWVGRSDALALRTVGVLRRIEDEGP